MWTLFDISNNIEIRRSYHSLIIIIPSLGYTSDERQVRFDFSCCLMSNYKRVNIQDGTPSWNQVWCPILVNPENIGKNVLFRGLQEWPKENISRKQVTEKVLANIKSFKWNWKEHRLLCGNTMQWYHVWSQVNQSFLISVKFILQGIWSGHP